MRLESPCPSINFSTTDIYGNALSLEQFKGKQVMLSFFRDAACPFCNFRLYELTNNYKEWQAAGLEVVVVFSSTADEVQQYVARHPRPFHMIADPNLSLYNQYGVEHSASALFKALFFKLPRIIKGIAKGGYPSKNPNVKIVPADFLLDAQGQVVDLWYGRDTADHIPMEKIQQFVDDFSKKYVLQQQQQIESLRREVAMLKKKLRGVLSPE